MQGKKQVFLVLGFLLLFNLAAWQAVFYFHFSPKELEAVFFDVGQGDSIFIKTPQGHQILIDGGPDAGILEKLSQEMPFWDRDLDMVILTHLDKDHLFGILEVLKNYKVENIVWSGLGVESSSGFKEWEKMKEQEIKEGAKETIISAGEKIIAGQAVFSALYPFLEERREIERNNEGCLVLKMLFKDNDFLFCADISFGEEEKITANFSDISAQVLKVAHHGSKYSTSESFLKRAAPQIAVIQSGKNSYGHPSEEVLTRLQKFDINTFRTDINGDIKIVANGYNLQIKK